MSNAEIGGNWKPKFLNWGTIGRGIALDRGITHTGSTPELDAPRRADSAAGVARRRRYWGREARARSLAKRPAADGAWTGG